MCDGTGVAPSLSKNCPRWSGAQAKTGETQALDSAWRLWLIDSRTLECPLTHLRLRRHRQKPPVWGSSDIPDVPKDSRVILITTLHNRLYHYLGSTDEETEARCLAGSPMFVMELGFRSPMFVMELGLEHAAPELMLSTTM